MRSEAEDGPATAAGWFGWQCATTKRNVPEQCLFLLFSLPLPPTGYFQKSDKEIRKIDRNASNARLRLFGVLKNMAVLAPRNESGR
jgi:hypothetical protein